MLDADDSSPAPSPHTAAGPSSAPSPFTVTASVALRTEDGDRVTITTPHGTYSAIAYTAGPSYERETRLAQVSHPLAMPSWLTAACSDIAIEAHQDGAGAWEIEHDGSGWAASERIEAVS